MFEKVIIAEDHESATISVRKTLEELGVVNPRYTYYCDDALLHLKNAIRDNEPYELLITDITFEPDSREQKLSDGEALIAAARQLQPSLKVLVFTAESKSAIIERLKDVGINGYVRKARRDAEELRLAITNIYKGKRHFPISLRQTLQQQHVHDFTPTDLIIIQLLAQGKSQKEISDHLTQNQVKPSGLSSLEKRLKLIRTAYDFSNNGQLIAFCKDIGII